MGARSGRREQKAERPYGSWRSPISSDLLVGGAVRLGGTALDGEDVYWLEGRPDEGGRNVVVHRPPGGPARDVNPEPFNARTRVHEYGGGDFLAHGGTVFFANFDDGRLYRAGSGERPVPLTAGGARRYADMALDGGRLLAVREDHTGGGEPANEIVGVDLGTGAETVLVSGNDFYSSPRPSPDGGRISWLAWDHPNMPWDGTELWTASLDGDGTPTGAERVAGGPDESVYGPAWSPDGTLHFVSDRTGWWNLYRLRDGAVEALCPVEAEFGVPQWTFGTSTYAFLSPTRIACTPVRGGFFRLCILDTTSGELAELDTPYSVIGGLRSDPASGALLFLAGSATEPPSVVLLDARTGRREVLRRSGDLEVDPAHLSVPEAVEFPTEGGLTAHGLFYPPKNKDFAAPAGELPPLLVHSHGGPTSMATAALDLEVQYMTSRGIAVLDVNYGGSTGYGREYRTRLEGMWGVVDVDDCVAGARHLAGRGLVDGGRLIIAGGSAGGYTTLCALAFRDVFAAGASYYGVSDAEALAKETHKFESRYLDRLIGPYPERADLYRERSPIHHAEGLSCPVIFFQGLEDEVVPPNQAEKMFGVLKEKGLPVAYVPFGGEQHGFRRAENIKRAAEGELFFYSRVFGFDLADPVEPIHIENPGGP